MDCALAILQLCLFDPSALTIEADIGWQMPDSAREYKVEGVPYSGTHGRVAILMRTPVTNTLRLHYGIEHRSLLETTADRGEEVVVLGLEWKPFAR